MNLGIKISSNSLISFQDRMDTWAKQCGCSNSSLPEIFLVYKTPARCVCTKRGYNSKKAPDEHEFTTVHNSFESISLSKIDDEHQLLISGIKI